jgi:methionine synthase I (cobalamin-dependent)
MSNHERVEQLKRRLSEGVLVADGALGTILSADGHDPGKSLDLLNVESPDLVRAAHRGYVEAGSELILTNTFQGSRPSLERHNLADRTAELNTAGAVLAREVAGAEIFVGGDIGPTGKILEPYGDYPTESARAAFSEQAQALAHAGVDCLVLETFSSLDELRIAVDAAVETGLPAFASMSFDPSGRTAFGVTPEQASEQLQAAGAAAVGANCGTISLEEMVGIIASFRQATSLPLIAQPNAGRPQQTAAGTIYTEEPESMAEIAARLRDLGATIIGGCCGSTPDHIRAIAARLRRG